MVIKEQYRREVIKLKQTEKRFNWIWLVYALLGFAIGMLLGYFLWGYNYEVSAKVDKVNICHTGDGTNYAAISVDDDGSWNGHNDHEGDYLYAGPLKDDGKIDNKDGQANKWCKDNSVKDVCKNIEGNQEKVPENYYEDDGNCYEKTPVCTDKEALNYDSEVDKTEYENNEVCEYKIEKSAIVQGYCDGTFKVTINGGDTRRTWRVEGVEAWIDYYESHTFDATSLDTVIEWWHERDKAWKVADESYVTRTPAIDCPLPEPEPEPEPVPGPSGSSGTSSAPQCTDAVPNKTLANFHVYRKGDVAEVKWLPDDTTNWTVNIYYKQVDSPIWQYSVISTADDGTELISGLGGLDITFAGQYLNNCAGGEITSPVIDGNTAGWVLFR